MSTRSRLAWGGALVPIVALLLGPNGDPAASARVAPGPRAGLPVTSLSQASGAFEQQLADKYAPILYMGAQSEACDSDGDPFVPGPVSLVLGHPEVLLVRGPQAMTIPGPDAQDLFLGGTADHLDLPGNPKSPGCQFETDFLSFGGGQPVTYAHVAVEPGKEGLAVQYWFYYYFNDWNNRHESDWEMIQLTFDEGSAEQALDSEPVLAIYAQHGSAEKAAWSSAKVRKESGRPVVYPSSGSHASYFAPNVYLGKGEAGSGFGCDDARGPHNRFDLEAIAVPTLVHEEGSEFAWLTFRGRWGDDIGGHNNGPTGPNTKDKWLQPITWAESVDRENSLEVPEMRSLGISPTDMFCGVVSSGSSLLFRAADYPVLTLSVLGVVVGGAAVGTGSLVRSTRRSGRLEGRAPELRKPRFFAAILVAAWRVYRAHWRPLLAITALLVPVAVLVGGIQQLIFENPPMATILDAADARGVSIVLAVLYGAGASLPFLLLATCGVIAAMAQLVRGDQLSVSRAWTAVLRELPTLFLARAKALLIVALLFASLIGIPWGVARVVRWYFIEQSILLDGADRRNALNASAGVVQGQWLRTLGITFFLGTLGALTGPVAASLLILFTGIPLWLINVFSSAVYALLLPFVGAGLTLLYWDLQERREGRMPEPAPAALVSVPTEAD
ncbi:MAG: hypothetical protein WD557_01155 [Dehalococcoidia bacterium]